MACRGSLVVNARNFDSGINQLVVRDKVDGGRLSDVMEHADSRAQSYFELWDYAGGNRFRGFVAQRDGKRGMFVFFDHRSFGLDMKPG